MDAHARIARTEKGSEMSTPTGIAIIGCGFIADSYRFCCPRHLDQVALKGVFDRDPIRLAQYQRHWSDRTYQSLDDVLADPDVSIVVNLTTPENHEAVTVAAIEAGKHVYSEKPLALTAAQAEALRSKAANAGVRLASAPCNILGESAQTAWRAVRDGRIGTPRVIYAELDDGMIHRTDFRSWTSKSGRHWPAESEFETGCTYEHAGYALSILCAMFGPVRKVTAATATIFPDKGLGAEAAHSAPDFSVGILEFDGNIIARLTNSVVAPRDHRMRIVGDDGTIEISELWDYASPVVYRASARGRAQRWLERRRLWPGRTLKSVRPMPYKAGRGDPTMDFLRGVVELADAIRNDRPCRLDENFAVHITEVTEILQYPERFSRPAPIKSKFAPIEPMEWAR